MTLDGIWWHCSNSGYMEYYSIVISPMSTLSQSGIVQSARAVEYTDCISAEIWDKY